MSLLLAAAVLVSAPGAARGDDQKNPKFKFGEAAKVEEVEWDIQTKAGLIYTSGNARTATYTVGGHASRKASGNKFALDAGLAYARSSIFIASDLDGDGFIGENELWRDTQTTANTWFSKARYDRFFTTHNSLYVAGLAAANKPAGQEFAGGGQLGYSRQLYKSKRAEAVAEIGYDYSYENYLSPPDDQPGSVSIHSARVFVGTKLKLHEATAFSLSAESFFNLNQEHVANASTGSSEVPAFEDTRVIATTALTTKLWKALSFSVSFSLKYDSNPAPRPTIKDAPDYAPGFTPFADELDTITEAALILNFI